jgi:hypothetical protein
MLNCAKTLANTELNGKPQMKDFQKRIKIKLREKKMIKKLMMALVFTIVSSATYADVTLVVPQKVGAGTSVWAQIVAIELEKFLPNDRVTVRHIPGAKGLPGFNKFHNELQNDDDVLMVSNGSNAVSFLTEEVDYNYSEYDSIGLMNLNIITGRLINADMNAIKFHSYGGRQPEVMAMAMLVCGPGSDVNPVKCFNDNIQWLPGFSQGEGRLAFKRGELNVTRENPAAFIKHIQPAVDSGQAEVWFTHGILQADGTHADDPNYPGLQFEILYKEIWGVEASGNFYDAYKLAKSFRDGLQKAIWIRKDNPNRDKIITAMTKMANDPESVANIQAKVGNYEWLIGKDGDAHRDTLMTFITEDALRTLVEFTSISLKLEAEYKPELINQQ